MARLGLVVARRARTASEGILGGVLSRHCGLSNCGIVPSETQTTEINSMRSRRRRNQIQTTSVFVRGTAVAAVCLFMISNIATSTAAAETLDILGQAGVLGEWELTANISSTDGARKQFSGPLVMKHVGICSVDGPEVKQGEIQLQLIGL